MHRLAPFLVGNADDRAFGDVGVLVERLLDLGGIDVLAAGDDHVLDPVDDIDEAVLVHIAAVAGVQPAVAQGLSRSFPAGCQ